MIRTLLQIRWLNLKRDYVGLGLTFILPIVFFSIFATIFGGMNTGGGGGARRAIVVDQDQTEISERFIGAIDKLEALRVVRAPAATEETPEPEPYTRESASAAVRRGDYSVALVILPDFSERFGSFGSTNEDHVELIYDASNPVAKFTVSGLMQAAAMTAAPDILMERGLGYLEQYGGALTPAQRDAVEAVKPALRGEESWDELEADGTANGGGVGEPNDTGESTETGDSGTGSDIGGLIQVRATDVRGEEYDMVSYYAAGISVMFLLFSVVNGAGGSLLEEQESGTLERLLSSHVGMKTLLLGNWLFFTIVGIAQVALMFIWGAFGFGLSLWTPNHLAGFIVVTLLTGAAAAAFGLVLATLCRSRAQLGGMSTIIILIMSALGGSMVPRFIMPAFMDDVAKFTFNGWALDGYLKVFWHDDPDATMLQSLIALWPQLLVLAGMTIAFLAVARMMARRWETV